MFLVGQANNLSVNRRGPRVRISPPPICNNCLWHVLILVKSRNQLFQIRVAAVNAARASAADLQVITQASANLVSAVRSSRGFCKRAKKNTVVGPTAESD